MADQSAHLLDTQLVERLREDDPLAFRSLYLLYYKRLYAFAYTYFKVRELAEEVVHDVFVKVWENRKAIDPKQSFTFFIFAAAKHRIIDILRKQSHVQLYHQALAQAAFEHTHTEDSIVYADYEAIARQAIEQLPEKRRAIFTLSRQQHLTYAQIAEQLGISQKTVEAQMHKALLFIKEYLQHHTEITFLLLLLIG